VSAIRQMTAADDAAILVITAAAERLQKARDYDTRSGLHAAVMAELETVYDEELIDIAVYDYCWSTNVRGDEPTFSDVRL
jgi:hypothetical protein